MLTKISKIELAKFAQPQLKVICSRMGLGKSQGLNYMTATMMIECILRGDSPFEFDESRFPRFINKKTGVSVNQPRAYLLPSDVPSHTEIYEGILIEARAKVLSRGERKPEAPTEYKPAEPEPQPQTKAAEGEKKVTETKPAAAPGIEDAMKVLFNTLGGVNKDEIAKIAKETALSIVKDYVSRPAEIKIGNLPAVKIDGLRHEAFDKVLFLLSTGRPTYIYGPTGSGKSEMARQLAAAMSCSLHDFCCGAETCEAHLVGRPLIHNGQFAPSVLLIGWEKGNSILFLDECDRLLGPAATVLNGALANGHFQAPLWTEKPTVKKAERVFVLGAGNTKMDGVSDKFTAEKQDAAFRNRFAMQMVHVGYDLKLEKELAKQAGWPVAALMVQHVRKQCEKAHVDSDNGTRQIVDLCTQAALAKACDWTEERINNHLANQILENISEDAKEKIKPTLATWLA